MATLSSNPRANRPDPTRATVVDVAWLTPQMVRVVVGSDDWSRFRDPAHADAYIKLVFPGERGQPADARPRMRTYTVRAFDRPSGRLTFDVVVHGTAGLAGPWAAAAQPGDVVLINGPGGGYTPDPAADWHLLVGDESALPAIAVALERMPASTPVAVFVEVDAPEFEIELAPVASAAVTWLHRGERPVGQLLADAVLGWPLPTGTGQVFVHGEAGFVRTIRRHLRVDHGLPMEQLSISGYWRLGVDDEGWRQVKREWNQAIDDDEATAAVAT